MQQKHVINSAKLVHSNTCAQHTLMQHIFTAYLDATDAAHLLSLEEL